MKKQKRILCFGDSNTWGANPKNLLRYPYSIRWPSILQKLLGSNYEVTSEGLPGRVLTVQEKERPHLTGITYLHALLESSDPFDNIVVMLGTNDIKDRYNLSAKQIATGLEQTIKLIIKKSPKSKILVICPPSIALPKSGQIRTDMKRGLKIFEKLPSLYEKVADKYKCSYLNAGEHISSSSMDGYHLDKESHTKLAEVVTKKIKQ